MSKKFRFTAFTIILGFYACSSSLTKETPTEKTKVETPSKAEEIIAACIQAHGGDLYEQAHFSFTFRGNAYRFRNNGNQFEYEYRGINKTGDSVRTLVNGNSVNVWINNQPVDLNEKQRLSYSDNLNSVIYFATLPYKLGDESVNEFYQGSTTIKANNYEVVKVSFDQEGGGTDFDDEYYYWINSETMLIDYLAYNYQTNGGGVRFRAAYHPRTVGGIYFQDYINYKAEVGTPLAQLPELYENGKLEEISRIETENILPLKN